MKNKFYLTTFEGVMEKQTFIYNGSVWFKNDQSRASRILKKGDCNISETKYVSWDVFVAIKVNV